MATSDENNYFYGSIQFSFKFHDFLEIEFQSQGFATNAPPILLLANFLSFLLNQF
jgi:hypothetical protein